MGYVYKKTAVPFDAIRISAGFVQGYGEMVANDHVKFSISGFDGKVLFY